MKTTPLALSEFDDIFVVDDLVPDVDRRAIDLQRPLDDVDRAHDAGAEAARRAKNDAKRGFAVIDPRRFRVARVLERRASRSQGAPSVAGEFDWREAPTALRALQPAATGSRR